MEAHGEAIDLIALGDKYEEKGYFRRLVEMFAGLGRPRSSPAYKRARLELQRQTAPLVAIVSVALFITILFVATALTEDGKAGYVVKVVEEEDVVITETTPNPPDDPVPPKDPEPDPLDVADFITDVPQPVHPQVDPAPAIAQPQVAPASLKRNDNDFVAQVSSVVRMKTSFSGRDYSLIGAKTGGGHAGGGNPIGEAAVLKVLWFLKEHQREDGSWRAKGNPVNPVSDTALAVLTFLAHGEHEGAQQSPYRKDFGPCVTRGIEFLIGSLRAEGSVPRFAGSDGHEYAFPIATYALCEAYGMTRNPTVKTAALTGLERIIRGQSPTGGWDYNLNPQSPRDDMSYAGWALQALKAGKLAGLHPDGLEPCLKKAIKCLKTRNFKSGGFNYTAGGNPTGLTATGCLALQLLGFAGEPEVTAALGTMRDWEPAFEAAALTVNGQGAGPNPQYYSYYATQCKYQAGMRQGAKKGDEQNWFRWNREMLKRYPSAITELPDPAHDHRGQTHKQGYCACNQDHYRNDVMSSCLVALQLMVYYRYLPTNQLALPEEKGGDALSLPDNGDVEVIVEI